MDPSTDARLMVALQRGITPIAWGCLACVLYLYLGPPAAMPRSGLFRFEPYGAYLVDCAVFIIAYPSRWRVITVSAISLMLGLSLAPFAHPHPGPSFLPLIFKPIGGAMMSLATRLLVLLATTVEPSA